MRGTLRRFFLLFVLYFLLFAMLGCDAFVRKFTRKPKKESISREEMVLVPEEYKPTMSKEQLYRQYFLFWQSWQGELITSLTPTQTGNNKKQVDCAQEAIKNLSNLRTMINEDKQKKLDIYINELKELKSQIAKDFYGTNITAYARAAERIKRGILRDFSYNKVRNDLI
jgi:hypothetical protein